MNNLMKMNVETAKVSRQYLANVVYLPVINNNIFSKNRHHLKAFNQQEANRWRVHIRAVSENRDKNAFQVLYLHFAPKIKALYLQQGMNSKAEELTHEVFLRVWQKAASYNFDKANVSTWIFTIARNLRIDYLRKKRIVEVTDDAIYEPSVESDIEVKLDLGRDKKSIDAIMNKMTNQQRQVIQKVYFEGLSHTIASQELGMTLGEVKSRVRSSLKFLRENLGGER